ncbi:hypothetical protein RSOLAG1IB_10989 [Rhizoctonia solani AG-1 IB]|uniref:Uncharacterized protein n=1 Tax=Thanatephorus cucumeris (strain AG1-IB / isolate 7/3/14) TaxID=1108050 RepID=A0A0B7G1D3_THACB|nr:hypothetical protein RSOLAG1IB_10989 [Rhizoctonia solani AG-1 IB]
MILIVRLISLSGDIWIPLSRMMDMKGPGWRKTYKGITNITDLASVDRTIMILSHCACIRRAGSLYWCVKLRQGVGERRSSSQCQWVRPRPQHDDTLL